MARGRRSQRFAALAAALPLALAACAGSGGGADPSTRPSSPSTSPTQSPVAQKFTPVVEGMRFVGEVEETGEGELEQALSNGKVIATVRNNLSDISHTVTGYSAKTGKQVWKRSGEGWLSCVQSSPIVCQATSYRQGVRSVEEASVLALDSGKLTRLDVGKGGKFEFVGTYDHAAYFLTWQGTDDIHMTSFDSSGAPLTDKNLQAPAPKKASDSTVNVDMAGPYASVRTESTSGVYVAGRNGYKEIPLVGPCMALKDGAVCQSEGGLTGVGPDSTERWSVKSDVDIVASTRTMDIKLDEAKKLFEGSLADSLREPEDSKESEETDTEDSDSEDSGDSGSAKESGGAASAKPGGANTKPAGARVANTSTNSTKPVSAKLVQSAATREAVKVVSSDPSGPTSAPTTKSTAPSGATATPSSRSSSTSPASARPSASSTEEPTSPSPKEPTGTPSDDGSQGTSTPSPSRPPGVSGASVPQPLNTRVLIATEDGPSVAKVESGVLKLSDGRSVDLGGGTLVGLDLSREIAVVNVEHRTPKGGENGGVAVYSSILVGADGAVVARLDPSVAEQLAAEGEGGDRYKPFSFAWQQDYLVFVDAVGRKIGVYEPEDK